MLQLCSPTAHEVAFFEGNLLRLSPMLCSIQQPTLETLLNVRELKNNMNWKIYFKPDIIKISLTLILFIAINILTPFFLDNYYLNSDFSLLGKLCGTPCSGDGSCPQIYVCEGFYIKLNILEIVMFLVIYYLISVVTMGFVRTFRK